VARYVGNIWSITLSEITKRMDANKNWSKYGPLATVAFGDQENEASLVEELDRGNQQVGSSNRRVGW
jgi:hypothetical protein